MINLIRREVYFHDLWAAIPERSILEKMDLTALLYIESHPEPVVTTGTGLYSLEITLFVTLIVFVVFILYALIKYLVSQFFKVSRQFYSHLLKAIKALESSFTVQSQMIATFLKG